MPKRASSRPRTRYYLETFEGKRIPLGDDLPKAIERYHDQLNVPIFGAVTFAYATKQYRAKCLPKKSLKTKRDQEKQLDTLLAAFPHALLDEIDPQHIAQYRDKRSAKISANREIALLSHLWNWSREQGFGTTNRGRSIWPVHLGSL